MISNCVPILLAASFVVLMTAFNRLKSAAQPLRLDLAEKGEYLLSRPMLSSNIRAHVEWMLDTAFSNRLVLLFGVLAIPCFAVTIVLNPKSLFSKMEQLSSGNPEHSKLRRELSEIHDKITLANHPILWLIVEGELFAFIPLALILSALLRGYLVDRSVHDGIRDLIETRRIKFGRSRLAPV